MTDGVLPRSFFSVDPVELAPRLIGMVISVTDRLSDVSESRSARIVECEAYRGRDDPASHAARKKTPRNEVMFGPPGHAYVYLNYGIHSLFNIVAEDEGTAGAVLIRAGEPLTGLDAMVSVRGTEKLTELCSGPGKFAQALGLTLDDNRADLLCGGRVRIIDDGWRSKRVICGPRVGIRAGLAHCWRFAESGSEHISGPAL